MHSYRVAKEQQNISTVQPQPTEQKQSTTIVWDVPTGWEQLDKQVSMRYATFLTPENIEVTVAVFPGDVGGLLANVNRWRGQVGVDPIQESELHSHAIPISGSNSYVVDVPGSTNRLLGTSISIGDGNTWFVKTVGDPILVGQAKEDIVAFSESFRIENQKQESASWEPPSHWMVDENASSILMSAYTTPSGARITLTALGGDGGGLLDNINRWRGQLALEPKPSLEEMDLIEVQNGIVVELISEDNTQRIVSGVVPFDNQTLFFKLTGSVEATEPELENFTDFVLSVGPANGGSD